MDAETVKSPGQSLHGSQIISMYLHHEIGAEDEKSLPTIPAHYLENQYRNRDLEASSVYSLIKEQGDGSISPRRKKPWKKLWSTRAGKTSRRRTCLLCTSACLILSILALFIYTTVRLAHFGLRPGLDALLNHWGLPGSSTAALVTWPTNFTRDIIPLPIHSHNDYWRRVPLLDAIAAGATGVEADIWHGIVNGTDTLLVGHKSSALTSARSLQNLYLNPLMDILTHQNSQTEFSNDNTTTTPRGVFDTNSTVSLNLLIDVKTAATTTWPLLVAQLQPLRDAGYLTYYNETSQQLIPRPITVIGTGNTDFTMVQNFTTPFRDIFFDAPLSLLPADTDHIYNATNSLYASGALSDTIGKAGWSSGGFSKAQTVLLGKQVAAAKERGLLARYWDTPAWPVGNRDNVWMELERAGVGMLNVDDLGDASRKVW